MTKTFFASDHHFGHVGILSPKMNAPRPFASIQVAGSERLCSRV